MATGKIGTIEWATGLTKRVAELMDSVGVPPMEVSLPTPEQDGEVTSTDDYLIQVGLNGKCSLCQWNKEGSELTYLTEPVGPQEAVKALYEIFNEQIVASDFTKFESAAKKMDPIKEKNKGLLHKKLGIPEDKKIPMARLREEKSRLHKKKEKDGKLSEKDLALSREVNYAINRRKSSVEPDPFVVVEGQDGTWTIESSQGNIEGVWNTEAEALAVLGEYEDARFKAMTGSKFVAKVSGRRSGMSEHEMLEVGSKIANSVRNSRRYSLQPDTKRTAEVFQEEPDYEGWRFKIVQQKGMGNDIFYAIKDEQDDLIGKPFKSLDEAKAEVDKLNAEFGDEGQSQDFLGSQHTALYNAKVGDRVMLNNPDFYSGVPEGATGTVASIRGATGVGPYPDPMKRLVFVDWDEYGQISVPRKYLERIMTQKAPPHLEGSMDRDAIRKVRNFWIDLDVDGRTNVATGPRGRSGGFRQTIYINKGGESVKALTLMGGTDDRGEGTNWIQVRDEINGGTSVDIGVPKNAPAAVPEEIEEVQPQPMMASKRNAANQISVSMDAPLLIRILEYTREDLSKIEGEKGDLMLHFLADELLSSPTGGMDSIGAYKMIIDNAEKRFQDATGDGLGGMMPTDVPSPPETPMDIMMEEVMTPPTETEMIVTGAYVPAGRTYTSSGKSPFETTTKTTNKKDTDTQFGETVKESTENFGKPVKAPKETKVKKATRAYTKRKG